VYHHARVGVPTAPPRNEPGGGGTRAPARRLLKATLALVGEHGVWEYYDPESGDGLGSERFSWTAALAPDLLALQAAM